MICDDATDRMSKGFAISCRNLNEEKKLYLFVRKYFLIWKTCRGSDHLQFREQLICDLVLAEEDRTENGKGTKGRPSSASCELSDLKIKHMKY
jgi:hypothetical protein